jgi:hypothetical protein
MSTGYRAETLTVAHTSTAAFEFCHWLSSNAPLRMCKGIYISPEWHFQGAVVQNVKISSMKKVYEENKQRTRPWRLGIPI